jgi:RNA polymerase sigma-70 factor (ECF subfamily)
MSTTTENRTEPTGTNGSPIRDHAWQETLESHLPSLRRYALTLQRRNQAEVEDLVHDCVVRALDAGTAHPPQSGKVRQWLFAILHNSFVNKVRRDQTRRASLELVSETAAAWTPPAQQSTVELSQLAAAVEKLPPSQKTVLMMVCVDGMQYKDVAEALGMPIGTVMSTLARARQNLRDADASRDSSSRKPRRAVKRIA